MSPLLWHCGYWYGPAANLDLEHHRADPEVALPPLRVRQWLNKPASMRPEVYTKELDAAQWIFHQMRNVARHLATVDEQWWSVIETAYGNVKREILAGHDVQWGHEVPRGMAVRLAVVVEYVSRTQDQP